MHTALNEQDAMIEGINAGADDYVAKSNELEVLSARALPCPTPKKTV